jgi:uroporphyrinogen decarboxylase
MGFDFLFCADDVAFKTGPMMSPEHFRKIILPHLKTAVKNITIPWVYHSDGNLLPIMEDWLSLGQSGIHPVEPLAMDIRFVKKAYGDRVCVCGNVDVNLLGMGTEQQVVNEVKGLIRDLAPGGGYMVSSGNSVPAYAKPENALAMGRAVRKYGKYPISI